VKKLGLERKRGRYRRQNGLKKGDGRLKTFQERKIMAENDQPRLRRIPLAGRDPPALLEKIPVSAADGSIIDKY
jgi:hypothetical protein